MDDQLKILQRTVHVLDTYPDKTSFAKISGLFWSSCPNDWSTNQMDSRDWKGRERKQAEKGRKKSFQTPAANKRDWLQKYEIIHSLKSRLRLAYKFFGVRCHSGNDLLSSWPSTVHRQAKYIAVCSLLISVHNPTEAKTKKTTATSAFGSCRCAYHRVDISPSPLWWK